MKKYIFAVALLVLSANAMADRVVSGSNEKDENSFGSRTEACRAAKDDVMEKKANDELVAKFSQCDCKQNEKGNWACNVEVTFKKAR
jgi:hypothetical protein